MRRFNYRNAAFLASFLAVTACGDSEEKSEGPSQNGPWQYGVELPADPHAAGDPEVGRMTLLNGSYMSCGIPWSLWTNPTLGTIAQQALGDPTGERLPSGREGNNVDLPYYLTAFAAADGTEVVNRNCLSCHGGHFDGELVLGLGNAAGDFTADLSQASPVDITPDLLASLGLTPAEIEHLNRMLRFASVAGPEIAMRTVGTNPAEAMTGILLSHHDQMTLEWSDTPLMEIVRPVDENGNTIPDSRLVSDPPPWWRAHKKHALFYNGMARGDHRGTMALASSVCVDNVPEAERVDALFKDMHAYVLSLRPPEYKRSIDAALAADGEELFTANCSGCHGTYAADRLDDENDTYPNLLLPLSVIGTDSAVADVPIMNQELTDWYNAGFYGQITPAVPDDPFPGYVAPPLDGVWATAPFLHNGSVPTVELVLNSKARPKYWKRVDFNDMNFDEEALGWPYEEVTYSQAEAPEAERKFIYDTTYWSQSNSGHEFGDHLTDDERRAVIEYLKTL